MLKLEKKLTGKYGSFFEISGGFTTIAEGMLDLVHRERTVPRGDGDEAKFSVTITITKANLTSVQRFLWNLAMKVSQDNFGFERLEDKTRVKGSIQVNEFDSYLTILRRTFTLLNGEPNKATQAIAPYLLNYLPQHLDALRNAPTGQPITLAEKQEIGDGLHSLFATGDVIERHWDSCGELIWYKNQDELEIFLGWLKDSDVTCGLGRMDRKWLNKVAASSNPCRALLMNVMKMVAGKLLQGTEWDVERPYRWIGKFLDLVC